jgi:DNA-directed RNA polymerase specialized sigma24 family protein
MATAAMTAAMATEDMAARSLRAPRALPLPGRRRQRAAGERIAGLFEEHGRMVYGVCRLLLRDADEAEDAAQQTFLSAYRGLLAGQEPREPAAWLGTIARNECRKRLRSRKTAASAIVSLRRRRDSAGGRAAGRDRGPVHCACGAPGAAARRPRAAGVLRLVHAEVAAALRKLSGPAVESLLFRSRRRLQERLRPLRAALGVLTIPVTLRESLAQALPGFGGGGVAAGAGATFLVKAGSAPVAAKFAAAALALGTAGTIAGVETHAVRHRPHARVEARSAPAAGPRPQPPSAFGAQPLVPARPAPHGAGQSRRNAGA